MPPMHDASEKLFQDKIVQIAKTCGWLTFHAVPHQVRPGVWRSDGPGFPDLVLAHPRFGILFAEIKTAKGKLTDAQLQWRSAIIASGHRHEVWRPADMNLIVKVLSGINN